MRRSVTSRLIRMHTVQRSVCEFCQRLFCSITILSKFTGEAVYYRSLGLEGLVFIIRCIYTERKKKRRVNFIPKFHSSLKKLVKYFTMITKRYMYGTKVPNFIGL